MKASRFKQILLQVDDFNSDQFRRLKESLKAQEFRNKAALNLETPYSQLCCPYCRDENKQRWGKRNGMQRYRCKRCQKTFNSLTDSPLARLRKKEQWLEYAACLISGLSIRKAASQCNIHRNTSFKWRHRFLSNSRFINPDKLTGIIEADETYFLKSEKGSRHLLRTSRKRGGNAKKRDSSKELICVLVCRDRQANTINHIFENFTGDALTHFLKNKITADVLFCSDSKAVYKKFVAANGYRHGCLNLAKGVSIIKDIVHIQNVNAYHNRLKEWLRRFHGVATKYLDNYLAWYKELDEFGSTIRPEILLVRGKQKTSYKIQPFTMT